MATVLNVIDGALKMLLVLAPGGTADTNQQADGVILLNLMIDSWRGEKLMCPWIVQESFALTSGDGQYSIGPGGDFNATRPMSLENSCFVRVSSVDYPITLINEAQYNSIPDKTVTGSFPQMLYYEPIYPLGVIKLWPLPGSGNTLYLSSLKQMDSIAGTGTTISVPPGYDLAYRSNLAVLWASHFGLPIHPSVQKTAFRSKRNLRQNNARIGVLSVDVAATSRFPSSGYVYGDIT